jgi:hypothetical protein
MNEFKAHLTRWKLSTIKLARVKEEQGRSGDCSTDKSHPTEGKICSLWHILIDLPFQSFVRYLEPGIGS